MSDKDLSDSSPITEVQVTTPDEPTEETTEDAPAEEKSLAEATREAYPFAQDWSDSEIENWYHVMGERKSPYVQGTEALIYDPRRGKRKANEWTTEELHAFVDGELEGVEDFRKREVIDELRRRVPIEPAWNYDEVLAFYRRGVEPKKTSTGAYVRDVTRSSRPADDWSNAELEAWALGEIKPEGKTTASKLALVMKERFALTTESNEPKAIINQYLKQREHTTAHSATIPETGLTPMNDSYIDGVLSRYAETLKPGRQISEETGGKAQRDLEGLFQYVLRLEGPALKQGLQKIKKFIGEHRKDVFDPTNAYRFVHLLKGDRRTQRRHINTVELFLVVTDSNKAKRKQVDIKAMLKEHTPAQQELLYDYFHNYA